jgi:hypothetical protein
LAGAIAAETAVNYYYPNDGTITSYGLAMYLDGTLKPNGTTIDWGPCDKGTVQSFSNVTVVNVGNVNLTVTITTTGLPADWVLEWQANNTLLEPNYEVEGWLNLTIPLTATVWPSWGFSLNGATA